MNAIFRLLCLIGLADGLFLMLSPRDWLAFWEPKMDRIAGSKRAATAFGLIEIGASLGLLFALTCPRNNRT